MNIKDKRDLLQKYLIKGSNENETIDVEYIFHQKLFVINYFKTKIPHPRMQTPLKYHVDATIITKENIASIVADAIESLRNRSR